jgi:hypothetical protein
MRKVPRVSRQERGRANFGLQPGRLTVLMDSRFVLRLLSVSPFTRPVLRRATPGLLLPSKRRRPRQPSPHRRVAHALSPAAYRRDLPTRRTAEGFTGHGWGPFSPGGGTHHRDGSRPTLRTFDPKAGIRVPASASSKGGDWRTIPAEMPSPKVSLPGPFVLAPSPVLPVALSWLHTSDESCEVRAESSVQARTRTGRLRRAAILLPSPHPFFWWYT